MTVRVANTSVPGILTEDRRLLSLVPLGFESVRELIEAGPQAWAAVGAADHEEAQLSLDHVTSIGPPLPDPPRNAFCVGVNYRSHFDEGGLPAADSVPAIPVIFTKAFTTFTGHDAVVPLHPDVATQVDYEAEIVAVIGRGGRAISEQTALDHVFGYCLGNDVSSRDHQFAGGISSQWFKGKGLDGFAPIGPALITADEIPDPSVIEVKLSVNGDMRQDFCAKDMVHNTAQIISYLSQGMSMLPGDVIFTGTSAGAGYWRRPPVFLRQGDVVEIRSPQLGVLRNSFGT